ncbi:DUF4214 domain-containing protein [Candidatus Riflebacteria bacterium]
MKNSLPGLIIFLFLLSPEFFPGSRLLSRPLSIKFGYSGGKKIDIRCSPKNDFKKKKSEDYWIDFYSNSYKSSPDSIEFVKEDTPSQNPPSDSSSLNSLAHLSSNADSVKSSSSKGSTTLEKIFQGKVRRNLPFASKELTALYRELLGRNPDPSGIKTYDGGVAEGTMTYEQVRQYILESEEYANRQQK